MKLKPNTKAPNFKLPSTDGDIFELGKIKKNIILLTFELNRQKIVSFKYGGIPKRSTGADCKSVDLCLRRFESCSPHFLL